MNKLFTRRWAPTALAAIFIGSAWPASVFACSTCKCGDPTITLLGLEKPYAQRFRVGFDYLLRSESQGQPGVDARWSQRNQHDGITDPDSGGTLVAASAALARRPLQELVLSLGVQTPVLDRLNGEQDEDLNVRASLTYDF